MRIDRCKGCGEMVDIATDHKPDCRNRMVAVILASSGKINDLGRLVQIDIADAKRIADGLAAAGYGKLPTHQAYCKPLHAKKDSERRRKAKLAEQKRSHG